MLRLRRIAYPIGIVGCMVAAFAGMIAPASAQTTASAAPAAVSAPAAAADAAATFKLAEPASAGNDCYDANGYNGAVGFWRCTGTSVSSLMVWSTCNQGNYNAGSYYNVYWWLNQCNTRVWLHQYTYSYDVNHGWAVCATPSVNGGSSGVVPPADVHPENIQVTANTAAC